jgi:hypothetical protein
MSPEVQQELFTVDLSPGNPHAGFPLTLSSYIMAGVKSKQSLPNFSGGFS